MVKDDKFISLIKAKIKSYESKINFIEEGRVISVNDGIVIASGLTNVMSNEIVKFENGTLGIAFNLEATHVGIVLLGKYDDIQEDSPVYRTKTVASICVGDHLLGRVIDPLGKPLDDKGKITSHTFKPIEQLAPGVMMRSSVDVPLETGTVMIDTMFPIGRGQRELIIGDRQTGKTSIAIDAIINQKGKNVKCIYVSIGQKNSTLARIINTLENAKALEYTTIVVASASDLSGIIYIAPYSGITIAEEWAKNGEDVLIVFDDLTKHAFSYRTMSLLLHRPSGREAYPGDIFYLHSRLLERACKLNKKNGGGSITALPIVETQNSDISTYIPTNIISITDGQLFLQTSLFNIGQKPAIDVGLSVSRIGSAAQNQVIKTLSKSIKIYLSEYYDVSSFAQFGTDLDENTVAIIENGKSIVELLKQKNLAPVSWINQAMILFLINSKLISKIEINSIKEFEHFYLEKMKLTKVYKTILQKVKIDDAIYAELKEITEDLIEKFKKGGKA